MSQQLTAKNRGAASLVWIKRQITNNFFDTPVTAILEVTVTVDAKDQTKEEKNRVRSACYRFISSNLAVPTQVFGHQITIKFSQEDGEKVHHVTQDIRPDIVKAEYVKLRLAAIQSSLSQQYPRCVIGLNFLISRPLEYLPDLATELREAKSAVLSSSASPQRLSPPRQSEEEACSNLSDDYPMEN